MFEFAMIPLSAFSGSMLCWTLEIHNVVSFVYIRAAYATRGGLQNRATRPRASHVDVHGHGRL